MAIDSKGIGDVGEAILAVWASQVRIATTKVQNDRHGWDYSLELPRVQLTRGSVSLDLLPCELRCFVQVKTTRSGATRARIKLSNWLRMVKDPVPWFVIVVVLNDSNEPTDGFLIHVDESWCSRVLRQLRELDESEEVRLHEHHLDVSWGPAQRLARLHGESLADGIRFHAGHDLGSYTARKQKWTEEAGYEDERHLVQIAVAASDEDEANEMKADFAVGLRETLPLSAIEIQEIRFAIPKPVDMHLSPGGRTEMRLEDRQPDAHTSVMFEAADQSESVVFPCDAYGTHRVFPDLPEQFHKIRLVAPFVSMTVKGRPLADPKSKQVRVTFAWKFSDLHDAAPAPLVDLGRAARAALMLHRSHEKPMRLRLGTEGVGTVRTDLRANNPLDPESLRCWTTILKAHELAGLFGVADDAAVSPAFLLRQGQAINFLATCALEEASAASFSATTTLPHLLDAKQAAMIFPSSIRLTDSVVGVCVALVGRPSWKRLDDGRYQVDVTAASIRVTRRFAVPAASWKEFDLRALVAEARRIVEGEGVSLVLCPDDFDDVDSEP